MDITKYFKDDGTQIIELAGAREIKSARAILKAVEGLRDSERDLIEKKPERNDQDLTKDWVYRAGMIRAFNIVLSLPAEARKYLDRLPESGAPK